MADEYIILHVLKIKAEKNRKGGDVVTINEKENIKKKKRIGVKHFNRSLIGKLLGEICFFIKKKIERLILKIINREG